MPDLSHIAQIDRLLNDQCIACYCPLLSRPVVSTIVKAQVERYRQRVQQQHAEVNPDELLQGIQSALEFQRLQRIQRVINATGILVHTNFGRSPLPQAVWQRAGEVVCHYSNLEMNLVNGKRGNRMGLLPALLQAYFGGDSSLIVNNNAAALYLLLKTFAVGKEVIVSRGEQIQIGGGFRIPEILEQSGAILRDVGTTNITTLDDYLNAVNENTAMVLVVHQSNYYIEGFTQHVDVKALAAKLPENVLLAVDQGSGNAQTAIPGEPTVAYYLKAGADLVCFSTDKMLGGPQGGVILGNRDLVAKLGKHPMMRAFRPGKETYALLEQLLLERLNHDCAGDEQVAQVLTKPMQWHLERAQRVASVAPDRMQLVQSKYMIGGGSTPRAQYDTWAVVLDSCLSAQMWLKKLRDYCVPIMGVTHQDQALLYPVTLLDDDFEPLLAFLKTQYRAQTLS